MPLETEEWVVLFYRRDRNNLTRKTKIGKAFLRNNDVINVCLEVLPLVNEHGECWITLAPYNPEHVEND